MSSTGADPARLRRLAAGLGDMAVDLDPRREPLRIALDEFRASSGWREWLDEVPPYDIDVGVDVTRIRRLGAFVDGVAGGLEAADSSDGVVVVDDSAIEPHVPALAPDADIQVVGDQVVVNGTDGDDHIRVVQTLGITYVQLLDEDGNVVATQLLTPEQQENLVIRGGDGDDILEVDPSYSLDIVVLGGRGDDSIGRRGDDESFMMGSAGDDQIYGGDGDDRIAGGAGGDDIFGGDGNDALDGQAGDDAISGGDGDDAIYTGAGTNEVRGGAGNDQLTGGFGSDTLFGGDDDDVVSGGGGGDDHLEGGDGDDVLYAGVGDDTIDGGAGYDEAHAEAGDSVTAAAHLTITIDPELGTKGIVIGRPAWMSDAEHAEWVERVDSDVDLLRSSPLGQDILAAIDDGATTSVFGMEVTRGTITIMPYESTGNSTGGGRDGKGSVNLDPYYNREEGTTRVLVHELGHAYDAFTGDWPTREQAVAAGYDVVDVPRRNPDGTPTLDSSGTPVTDPHFVQPNGSTAPLAEINTVGFDIDGDGDIDPTGDHPDFFNENTLRDELGWPRRENY